MTCVCSCSFKLSIILTNVLRCPVSNIQLLVLICILSGECTGASVCAFVYARILFSILLGIVPCVVARERAFKLFYAGVIPGVLSVERTFKLFTELRQPLSIKRTFILF